MESVGKKNSYQCELCGLEFVTVNLADGVTPFMVACRATPNCNGMAESSFYQIDQSRPADWGWFKPSQEQIEYKVRSTLALQGITDKDEIAKSIEEAKWAYGQEVLMLRPLDAVEREQYGGHRTRHG